MLFVFLVLALQPFLSQSFRLGIIAGKSSDISDFPYQLSLSFDGFFTCGASIISPHFALTAAHCTYSRVRDGLIVRAGSTFRSSGGIEIFVSHIIQHPKFSIETYDFDFSLLRFAGPLTFDLQMRAVRLPGIGEILVPGTKCIVSGFGMTEYGEVPEDLRSAEVKIIEDLNCKSNYAYVGFETTKQMMCAGENNTQKENGNRDACSGDSGGPLVCGTILCGVVSLGYSCGLPNFPGLYSRVSSVRSWIRTITGV